jgi:hypothetical protein
MNWNVVYLYFALILTIEISFLILLQNDTSSIDILEKNWVRFPVVE